MPKPLLAALILLIAPASTQAYPVTHLNRYAEARSYAPEVVDQKSTATYGVWNATSHAVTGNVDRGAEGNATYDSVVNNYVSALVVKMCGTLSASQHDVSIPAGYYGSAASANVEVWFTLPAPAYYNSVYNATDDLTNQYSHNFFQFVNSFTGQAYGANSGGLIPAGNYLLRAYFAVTSSANTDPTFLNATRTGDFSYRFSVFGHVPGDWNSDAYVDAADYVVLRNSPSIYDESDYLLWRANFGRNAFDTVPLQYSTVPEPSAIALAIVFIAFISISRRKPRV